LWSRSSFCRTPWWISEGIWCTSDNGSVAYFLFWDHIFPKIKGKNSRMQSYMVVQLVLHWAWALLWPRHGHGYIVR
jgi:hypothetical protein